MFALNIDSFGVWRCLYFSINPYFKPLDLVFHFIIFILSFLTQINRLEMSYQQLYIMTR